MTTLKGMTWSHPRGVEPLLACSKQWFEQTGVQIQWDQRSLQDFESYPVQELAKQYDLIVVDHPHVGQITVENCLYPLDNSAYAEQLKHIEAGSVGQSVPSYRWQGRQWALPIDAATQVQAWRPDRLSAPVGTWKELLQLARQGGVILPLRAPHSLMTLYTLAIHAGCAQLDESEGLFNEIALQPVIEQLAELVSLVPEFCWEMDPIAVYEQMAQLDSAYVCSPYIYGYVNYAYQGFRPIRLAFADMPVAREGDVPKGSALGGTGIAVSAFCEHLSEAQAFAYWVASGEVQRSCFALNGGQPGHAEAWEDELVNQQSGEFYRLTRKTLEHAWVRPRHNGYMRFQQQSSAMLNQALKQGEPAKQIAQKLNALYRESFVTEAT